jgi:alpha-L-fucosidase
VVRKLQPKAVIFSDVGDVRWVGNEDGLAGETNWSTFASGKLQPGQTNANQTAGNEDGDRWAPTETDVSIRPGWFYHASQDEQVKSLDHLMTIYLSSIGRNSNLLLNVPADRRGLIHENDVKRLAEFRAEVDRVFKKDLAKGGRVSADSVRGHEVRFASQNVIDGKSSTYWAAPDNLKHGIITVTLKKPALVGYVGLAEFIELGQRVRKFAVDVWVDNSWKEAATGTTIGYNRIVPITPVTTDKVRIRLIEAKACPTMERVSVFPPR